MDCKKAQRAISELNQFDFQFLPSTLREHISACPSCSDELKWAGTVCRQLKSLQPRDPGQDFWDRMSKSIQVELMIGGMETYKRRWWLWRVPAWVKLPALASGLAAAAVVIAFWSPFSHQWIGSKPIPMPRIEIKANPPVSESCRTIAGTETGSANALDTATKEELNACVRSLVSRGIQTREIASWDNDPVIMAGTDIIVDNNLRYLGPGELERLSHLLNQRYPR
jgi:hypothetical protein